MVYLEPCLISHKPQDLEVLRPGEEAIRCLCPPVGKKLTMKSLDFWREEKGLIRENWVLIDLLNIYDQLGVDVFSRMRERTVARQQVRPAL